MGSRYICELGCGALDVGHTGHRTSLFWPELPPKLEGVERLFCMNTTYQCAQPWNDSGTHLVMSSPRFLSGMTPYNPVFPDADVTTSTSKCGRDLSGAPRSTFCPIRPILFHPCPGSVTATARALCSRRCRDHCDSKSSSCYQHKQYQDCKPNTIPRPTSCHSCCLYVGPTRPKFSRRWFS